MRNGRKRAYHITNCSLGFAACSGGNGIKFKNLEDLFVLVFDLRSTREASKSLTLFTELTGGSLTLKLSFERAMEKRLNFFSLPNNSVNYSLNRNGKLPKFHYSDKLVLRLDNVTVELLVQRFNYLSETFCGVWSADNFPAMKQGETFQIVNTEVSCRSGLHWILLCTRRDFARRRKASLYFRTV